jgi:histidinol dehydrogenase
VGLEKIGSYAEKLADIEGLDGHKQAVSLRLAEIEVQNAQIT